MTGHAHLNPADNICTSLRVTSGVCSMPQKLEFTELFDSLLVHHEPWRLHMLLATVTMCSIQHGGVGSVNHVSCPSIRLLGRLRAGAAAAAAAAGCTGSPKAAGQLAQSLLDVFVRVQAVLGLVERCRGVCLVCRHSRQLSHVETSRDPCKQEFAYF